MGMALMGPALYSATPGLGPNVGIGMPMEPARQQPPQFVGGLRPAPVGYKPPVNAGGILRRRTR